MKTTEEIYSELCDDFTESTGMAINDFCDMAVRMHAVAAQIYSLYAYNDWVKRQCFPQTATGEYLDYHAQMRGITRNAATYASGEIRFRLDEARQISVPIPEGTVCITASGLEFKTIIGGEIEPGETFCDVPATAIEPGINGNVAENSITFMAQAPVGVTGCTNIERFTGGMQPEADESLRKRILESYNRLPNGANAAYYEKIVMDMDDVASVKVLAKRRGIGTVDIIVTSGDGMPEQELVTKIKNRLDELREICVDIGVAAPKPVTVDLSVKLLCTEGRYADTAERVKAALRNYFNGEILGKSVYIAKLGSVIFGIEGVENYKILSPAEDISIDPDELAICGNVSISEWS